MMNTEIFQWFYLHLSFIGLTCNLSAQTINDHLVPEAGIFNIYDFQYEYYSTVRNELFDGLEDRPIVRYQRMPSFSGENLLNIYKTDSTFRIIYHESKRSIWYNPEIKPVIYKFTKQITVEEVNLIKSLYKAAIDNAQYPEEDVRGLDGTTYIFSYQAYGLRTGKTWSPRKGTLLNRLVKISDQIIENVKVVNKKLIVTEAIEEQILSLISELNQQK